VLNNPPTGLNVYYMDDSNALNTLLYKSGWNSPVKLSPAGTVNGTSPLAAVYVPDVFTYQIFYLDTGGAMHSYSKVNATGAWVKQASNTWTTSDPGVGISAAAWDDQVRLFYYNGGKLNQGAVVVPKLAKTAQTWKSGVVG
jgi:hypothetical protein